MILAFLLQSVLATTWPELPNPTDCWSGGTHYKLVRSPNGIDGEPYFLQLEIKPRGRKSTTITIDNTPGYYEQLAICPRPSGVLIAEAPWRNVRFWAVDQHSQLWTIPLMLSSDEGLIGVNKQGIVYLESERRKGYDEVFRLRVFSANKLDLVDYQP
jgi:hypothetical protein